MSCPRCHDATTIARYAHVRGGVCFRCGRAPAARPTLRADAVTRLFGYVQAARSQGADWDLHPESAETVRGLLAAAGPVVRARFLAALTAAGHAAVAVAL
jgi:hypothetical protein